MIRLITSLFFLLGTFFSFLSDPCYIYLALSKLSLLPPSSPLNAKHSKHTLYTYVEKKREERGGEGIRGRRFLG
jgi:hypothetical protein